MDIVQWGIIGCGDVTEKKSGPAFNKVRDSRLVAVMRRDAGKAKDYAERHGVPKWYASVHDLIHDKEVNAVYVATPPVFHDELTILALKAGKPVYVEKPMAINAYSAEKIQLASSETGVKVSVAHYRREQPLFKKVKELIEGNSIGTVRIVNMRLFQPPQPELVAKSETNWRVNPEIAGGGFFHDLAPHQLDLMIYFFGNPIEATGLAKNQAGLYNADDIVSGHIYFERSIVFNGSWCFNVSPSEALDSCEIIGTEGSMHFSIFKNQDLIVKNQGGTSIFKFDQLEHVQQPMIQSVVQYFRGRGPNPCPAEDGVLCMRLIDALASKKSFTKFKPSF